ncbi:MAG: hypothetical protein EOP49_12675 [Sphingobacteriales bacterium]|nr:MAG: hypothetical protein EOP49_12675 [Sphingobacteriales bacterium]
MDIAATQKQICKIITGIGGHIKYRKELGLPARLFYFISRKQPVINIEAYFLGERFGVIIDEHKSRHNRSMFNSSGYRIIICNGVHDFNEQFDLLKAQKLSEKD